jgi:hypothetical protein
MNEVPENEQLRLDRVIRFKNAEELKAEAELAENPPQIEWEIDSHGIWHGRERPAPESPPVSKTRRKRPPCNCDIYGSPKRRPGDHHAVGCGRRESW